MTEIGIPTYNTRVERWECDYNDHWNTRFYGRSFELAADTIAIRAGVPGDASRLPRICHIRYHRELRVSAPVEVRSSVLTGAGALDGAVVHLMHSNDTLSATALDIGGHSAGLPQVTADQVALALPRGVTDAPTMGWDDPARAWFTVELGPVQPDEIDRAGLLRVERVIRNVAIGEHAQLNKFGLTQDFANRVGINRMSVEFRISRLATVAPDTLLRGQARLTAVEGKRFWTQHRLIDDTDRVVAMIEMCIVTVDLKTRRAVEVPSFFYDALG